MAIRAGEVEAWVREDLLLAAGVPVTISEQPGADPRCYPVVVQVWVGGAGGDGNAFHVERPLAEVERMDLVAALAFGGEH